MASTRSPIRGSKRSLVDTTKHPRRTKKPPGKHETDPTDTKNEASITPAGHHQLVATNPTEMVDAKVDIEDINTTMKVTMAKIDVEEGIVLGAWAGQETDWMPHMMVQPIMELTPRAEDTLVQLSSSAKTTTIRKWNESEWLTDTPR